MSESTTVYVLAERGNDILMHWFLFVVSGLYDLSHLPKPIRFHTRISEGFQRETLELLKPDYEYVENITGYDIVHHEGAPVINVCHVPDYYYHFVRNQILVKNKLEIAAAPTRRIYISRSKSHLLTCNNGRKKRQIIDEHLLMDKLRTEGFECINLEDYSLLDKLRLFQEAKLIVSPNGGALTMCYFAHPQTTIFIIQNKGTQETQYSHICDVLSIPVMYYENIQCLDNVSNQITGGFNEDFSIKIPDYDDLLRYLPPMTPRVLLVAIAIGDKYLEHYNSIFRPSHEAYAKRCNYDFKVVTDYLDPTFHSKEAITFNKILVCSQPWSAEYDYIIVVDADILINPAAPPLHSAYVYGDKIGMVDEYSQPTPAIHREIQIFNGFEETATDYYMLHAKRHIQTENILNTGLMVLQPVRHKTLLEHIYNTYSSGAVTSKSGYHYEQSCVGYEIQKAGVYMIMENRWNAIWCLQSILGNMSLEQFVRENYFTHFVGGMFHEYVQSLRF